MSVLFNNKIIFIFGLTFLSSFKNANAGIGLLLNPVLEFLKAISPFISGIKSINYCYFKDCCYLNEIQSIEKIKSTLSEKVFGQHIAVETISKLIHAHFTTESQKALVISLHGPPGTGKNYIVNLIAQIIFKKGIENQNVHLFSSRTHFIHKSRIEEYRNQLSSWIAGNVSNCARSMFIFDEANDLPFSFIDVLVPFMDNWDSLRGVDYRKSIFIFLSNTGSTLIEEYFIEQYINGHNREEITLAKLVKLNNLLLERSFNESGAFMGSSLIKKRLISFFIPFLPLEKKHIRQCIRAYLKEHFGLVSKLEHEDEIINEMKFGPSEKLPLFSLSGCRGIPDLVNLSK